jgi:SMC interacting uncharacterized protein involved in chromosome segregation
VKDQERDLNRDIYTMAQTYQRKVDEFDVLLSEYSREASGIESKIRGFQVELNSESALTQLEVDKAEIYREQIAMVKDRIKYLQAQLEQKSQAGEEIYNELRDYISLQEERIRVNLNELSPLTSGGISGVEVQVRESQ